MLLVFGLALLQQFRCLLMLLVFGLTLLQQFRSRIPVHKAHSVFSVFLDFLSCLFGSFDEVSLRSQQAAAEDIGPDAVTVYPLALDSLVPL